MSLQNGEYSQGFEMLRIDLDRGATQLVESDPWRKSFSTDFLRVIEVNPSVAAEVDSAFRMREIFDQYKERSPVTPSYAGNIALRAVHVQLFDQPGYPFTHTEVGTWENDIEEIVLDGSFKFDVSFRDVMSNVIDRYATLLVISKTIGSRFGEKLDIVDVGASQNHGLKTIAALPEFLQRPRTRGLGMGAFKRYMNQFEPNFGRLVGIEKWADRRTNELDDATKQWAKACSLPPHEMIDKKRRRRYETLDSLRADGVLMHMGEIGTRLFVDDEPSYRNTFHIVNLGTVMYQLSEEKRQLAIEQSRELLVDGGVLIIQDHMSVGKNGEMDFNVNWKNKNQLPYRTAVLDTAHSSMPLTEVFRWTNGRVVEGTVAGLAGFQALRRLAA